jgi:hypothetical protein
VNFKIYLFGGRSYREFQNQLFWRAERWAISKLTFLQCETVA